MNKTEKLTIIKNINLVQNETNKPSVLIPLHIKPQFMVLLMLCKSLNHKGLSHFPTRCIHMFLRIPNGKHITRRSVAICRPAEFGFFGTKKGLRLLFITRFGPPGGRFYEDVVFLSF